MKKLIIILSAIVVLIGLGGFMNVSTDLLNFSSQKAQNNYQITNTWYSSLFFDPYSKPLYALPGSYQLTQKGLEIGKPKAVFNEKAMHYSHIVEFLLTFKNDQVITKKDVTGKGEWDVAFTAHNRDNQDLNIHIIKGNPGVFFNSTASDVVLHATPTKIEKLTDKISVVRSHNGAFYLFIAAKGLDYDEANKQFIFAKSEEKNVVFVLPDEFQTKPAIGITDVQEILSCAENNPLKTNYSFALDQSSNNYSVEYTFADNSSKKYAYTVWPHMGQLPDTAIFGTYATHRGKLQLVCGNKLELTLKSQNLSTSFQPYINEKKLKDPKAAELFDKDYDALFNQPPLQGVYFRGKYIKNLVDLWEISKLLNKSTEEKALYAKLHELLTADLTNFTRDEKSDLVFYKHPEFGNETGNDHHYQYGYYIYAYSKLYPTFSDAQKSQVRDLISQLVAEGLPVVSEGTYPRQIRFFDPYELHSWADAKSLFPDGNNQESTSEALFYWYSLYVWSQQVNDTNLGDWARFLFFAEQNGRDTYWFFINNKLVANSYSKPFLSLVFGGKADYATWFSGEDDKILGIQLLPINPSSFVSLNFQNISKAKLQELTTKFDAYFTGSPKAGFYNYYLFFKKINGLQAPETIESDNSDYYSQSLYYIIK